MATNDKPKTTTDINAWMITRGINPNTYQQYRKETKKYGHTSKGFTDEFLEWYLFRCSEAELKLLKERSVLPEFKGDFKDNQLKMIAEYEFNKPNAAQEVLEIKSEITKEEIGEMQDAIKDVKQELKKEATPEDYKNTIAELQNESNMLYDKIQALQDERDTLKQQCDKVVRSVEIVEHNANEHDHLKFLYNLMNDKMVFKSKLIEEWRTDIANKGNLIVVTEGEFLLKIRDWEKECPITQQEEDKVIEITKIMESEKK